MEFPEQLTSTSEGSVLKLKDTFKDRDKKLIAVYEYQKISTRKGKVTTDEYLNAKAGQTINWTLEQVNELIRKNILK